MLYFSPDLRSMDAFGGVGGIFGALLQTGNYQLGMGTLAAGSGRNIVLVAASLLLPKSIGSTQPDTAIWCVVFAPQLVLLTPGSSCLSHNNGTLTPYWRAVNQNGPFLKDFFELSVTIDAITFNNAEGKDDEQKYFPGIFYLYTT